MKRVNDILREMAFNSDAPESTTKAFMRHLQKSLNQTQKADVVPLPESSDTAEQLSFDLQEIRDFDSTKTAKKSS